MQWTDDKLDELWDEQVDKLEKLLEDMKPLYIFMGDHEKVLKCDWFDNHVQAVAHARTLDSPLVNVFVYVGAADNKQEIFYYE